MITKKRILKYSFFIFTAIVMIEIGLRFFFLIAYKSISFKILAPLAVNVNYIREKLKKDDRFFTTTHKELGFVIKPDINVKYPAREIDKNIKSVSYKTISIAGELGARDDGIDKEFWAVALGDSYTFCYSVEIENCWTEILERKTGKDVLNLGVPGTGTKHQMKILEYFIKRYDKKPKIVFLMFNFTDYLDDECYTQRKNCNVFSPNTAFLFEDSFLGNFFLLGIIKTYFDVMKTKKIYLKLQEPNTDFLKIIEDICECKLILIPAYNYPKRTDVCRKFKCVDINYRNDMFMKEHHNEKAQEYIAERILDFLRNKNESEMR